MIATQKIIEEIKNRFSISKGYIFKFAKDVTIITLEDLEFALSKLEKEGKLKFFSGKFHEVEKFYKEVK